jgi:hypothetical protein
MQRLATLVAAAATALTAGAASAQFTEWGQEAGWKIMINTEMGGGCLITKTEADGDQVQIGYNPSGDRGYIAAYALRDTDLAAGEKVRLFFDLDNDYFYGEAVGQAVEGYHGGYVWFDNPDFLTDIENKRSMVVWSEGVEPFRIDLTGTKAAIAKALECQAQQGS